MPVSTPKYKNLFCQTLKKQVLIRGFLLYCMQTQGSRLTFQLTSLVASDKFDSLGKTVFSLARYSNSVSARKLYWRVKVAPEDLF